MSGAIERQNPAGAKPTGLKLAAIERNLVMTENGLEVKPTALFEVFDQDTKNAVIVTAREVSNA